MGTLQVMTREGATSAEVKRLRAKGILPMALIVKGKGTRLIQATHKEVRTTLKSSGGVPVFGVSVDSDPREIKVVVKEVQRDIITRGIIHLTLQEVKDDDVIRINVPIVFSGEPDSVTKKRSSLMTPMVVIEIFAKPANIPDHITVDLSGLGENDKVVVGDLQLPDGVSTHVSGDALVATTFHMKAVVLEAVVATVEAVPVEGEMPEDGEAVPVATAAPAAEAKKEK